MNAKYSFYSEFYSKIPQAPPTAIAVPPPLGGGLKANLPFNHHFSEERLLLVCLSNA